VRVVPHLPFDLPATDQRGLVAAAELAPDAVPGPSRDVAREVVSDFAGVGYLRRPGAAHHSLGSDAKDGFDGVGDGFGFHGLSFLILTHSDMGGSLSKNSAN
jgi:hypothetical protein